MRTLTTAVMALAEFFMTSQVMAQALPVDHRRGYTIERAWQPYAYPAFGWQYAYPEMWPYYPRTNEWGDPPEGDFLWPYRNSTTRDADAYRDHTLRGYPASSYAWRDYSAPYRWPGASYGRPAYPRVRRGPPYSSSYYGGYSPYMRNPLPGRNFRYSAPPVYQPRTGGMFDR